MAASHCVHGGPARAGRPVEAVIRTAVEGLPLEERGYRRVDRLARTGRVAPCEGSSSTGEAGCLVRLLREATANEFEGSCEAHRNSCRCCRRSRPGSCRTPGAPRTRLPRLIRSLPARRPREAVDDAAAACSVRFPRQGENQGPMGTTFLAASESFSFILVE